MPDVVFTDAAWDDYLWWQGQDKKTLKRINALIRDISRDWHAGLGQPEPLRGDRSGFWSRRINAQDRIVYPIGPDGAVRIVELRGHYS
jgi:toxin YoeB